MTGRAAGEQRVGFLVAGVQKAGTTALFDYLSDLPGLELPRVKEAHFFDDETGVDWAAPDYAPYHALFSRPDALWGEATPIYTYWPNALERIAAYNPAMKLILLFRDPIERAWSHWKMEFAKRKETEPFAWCVREGRARMAEASPYPGHHRVYSYVERGYYHRQLARALALFPREQLLLLDSDALKRDADATLARVCDFLGQPLPKHPIASRVSNASREINYPSRLEAADVAFLQQHFANELAAFGQLAASTANFTARWLDMLVK